MESFKNLDVEGKKRRFNALLVDSFLGNVEFGEVILRFLELNSSFRRDELAEKPELFAGELEDLFGDGAKIIKERMIRDLYSKIGMEYKNEKGRAFSEYIRNAYQEYLKNKP
jgi:hypothetical protein